VTARLHRVCLLVLCGALAGTAASAQETLTENTLRLAPGASSPPASIEAVRWLAGHWTAEALGGTAEEIWSPPRAGSMMGVFRLVRDGAPAFYEILTIVEEKGSLLLRLKHFHPDLRGWEEKDETVDFPLVATGDGVAHFEGMSFRRQGDSALTVHVALGSRTGTPREAAFPYVRVAPLAVAAPHRPSPVVSAGFVFERAPFRSAHASTVVETRDGLLAAWFGGTEEGHPDVGIWVSRHDGAGWSAPVEVATGVQPDGTRHPCWNPVLFRPAAGPLVLFYKVGPSPREWWGLALTSSDEGRSWSLPVRLPEGVLGPIRAKPVELPGGELVAGSSTEHAGWVAHVERFGGGDLASAAAWSRSAPLDDPAQFGAIQPTLLLHSPTRLQALCRSRQGVVTQAWSEDGGASWGSMTATDLPNPSAGIDALRLADGRFLLAYNPTRTGRERLDLAVSADGKAWAPAVALEDSAGEYSYPALVQAGDGLVHVTYTWRRERIRHVVVDPASIR
jgi:predicted neuraminidase